MKEKLIQLREKLDGVMKESDLAYADVLFHAKAYHSVFLILKREAELDDDYWFDFKKSVLLAACYFVSMRRIDYVGSFSMVYSYYQTYNLFESSDILEILSNRTNLYYDSSDEALLGAVLALYENETDHLAEDLISENL